MTERCNYKQKPTASCFRASQANLSEQWWSTEDVQPLPNAATPKVLLLARQGVYLQSVRDWYPPMFFLNDEAMGGTRLVGRVDSTLVSCKSIDPSE